MYALVDCNNFYCSCERVFNPKLNGKSVVVLSNNDGCVISRSEEAKALNVKMGAPAFTLEKFFERNNVMVFSSNYTLYGDISDRVMQTLTQFVPRLEIYSIDEAFLDMHDLRYIDLLDLGVSLKKTVYQNTGIPVSVGIAPTKTLAKMANRYAKKTKKNTGVYWAANGNMVTEMLSFTDVGDIWGIGPQYAKFLIKNGFKTALDLSKAPEEWIRINMSVVGQRLLNELKGIPAIQWEFTAPAKKNICIARGFGQLIRIKHELGEALASYTGICAGKLRKQNSCCKSIDVFVETNPFRKEDQQYRRSLRMQLPVATNNTSLLIKYSMKALDIIFKEGYNYHKTGIIVLDLIPEDQVQYTMYDASESDKEKAISKTLDSLNGLTNVVRYATQGYGKKWNLKQVKLSPRYTTRINEILNVKI